jgi:hypothetical protein
MLNSRIAVLSWWKKKSEPELPPLKRSAGPRVKTYSAAGGYVFQYQFAGQRTYSAAVEYVFEISHDRGTRRPVSVWVSDEAVRPWSEANGRELTASERYAVAKIALRNIFDEATTPGQIAEAIHPGADEVLTILVELDV